MTSLGAAGSASRYAFWRARTSSLSTTGRRRSKPSRVRSWIQRSIMNAARWPAPVARVMSEAPVTTSPAANSHGTSVWSVRSSTTIDPFGVGPDLAGERRGVRRHADRA